MSITSMLLKDSPTLSYDSDYYQLGLDHWASIRDTVPDMINFFKENIDIFIDGSHHRPWRMLSVGCGSGLLDLPLLNFIADRFPKLDLEYEALDPSSSRLESFRISAATLIANRPQWKVKFHQSDLEHYADPIDKNTRFHLMLCARVLYYMHDRLDITFVRLFEKLLEPESGKILVFHQSPSGLAQIAHIVGMTQQSPAHACNTYHLKLALDRISISHPSLYYRVTYLDKYTNMTFLNKVHSEDQTERDKAINLLSFTLGKDLRGVEANLIENAITRILDSVTFEAAIDNQHIMFQPIGVVIIENRLRFNTNRIS